MATPAHPVPALVDRVGALHDISFGWARSCCGGDADEAADVLQSSYVKVLTGAATFDERASLRTWWFGVIRFTALEAHRRSTRALSLAAPVVAPDAPRTPDEELADVEEGETLRRALSELPDRQRDVLHLVFYQGLSLSEAAVILEISVGSVRVHYDRGKRRLRERLTPWMRDDDDRAPEGGADA
jgi:RNA polymerase sigma-70 factor (ECF subfamily)